MAYLYCKKCGKECGEFFSILDLTKEFIAKVHLSHDSSCKGESKKKTKKQKRV